MASLAAIVLTVSALPGARTLVPTFAATGSVVITQTGGSTDVKEGGPTDSYTVTLSSAPTGPVTVTLNKSSDQITFTITQTSGISPGPNQIIFTAANYNQPRTVTVTATNDSTVEQTKTATITHSPSTFAGTDTYSGATVTVTVRDNDAVVSNTPQNNNTVDPANNSTQNPDVVAPANNTSNNTTNNATNNLTGNSINNTPPTNSVNNTSNNTANNTPTNLPDNSPAEPQPTSAPGQSLRERTQAVLQNPTVVKATQITNDIVNPITTTAVAISAAAVIPITTWYPLLLRIFLEPAQLLTIRRRRGSLGTVRDSLNDKPVDLAIVRLFGPDQRVIGTRVTDREGRYGFLLDKAGQYRMGIHKAGFTFPSNVARDQVSRSGQLQLAEPTFVANTVLIDPSVKALGPKAALRRHARHSTHAFVSYAGIFVGVIAAIFAHTALAFVLLAIHVLLFFVFRLTAVGPKARPWGRVYRSDTGKPVSGAVVRVFDLQYNRHLDTQVTDRLGRFAFTTGQRQYRLDVYKPGFALQTESNKSTDYHGQALRPNKNGVINVDIALKAAAA